MSTILNIDTLASANRLKQAGADDKLAEAIVEVLGAAEATDLATKADLDTGLAEVHSKIDTGLAEVRTEIAEVKSEISRSLMVHTRWILGALLATVGLTVTLIKFLPGPG